MCQWAPPPPPPPHRKFCSLRQFSRLLKSDLVAGILLFLTSFLPCISFQTNLCVEESSAAVLVRNLDYRGWPSDVEAQLLGPGRGAGHSSVNIKKRSTETCGVQLHFHVYPWRPSLTARPVTMGHKAERLSSRSFGRLLHVRAGLVIVTALEERIAPQIILERVRLVCREV